jgi:hypothetical protein
MPLSDAGCCRPIGTAHSGLAGVRRCWVRMSVSLCGSVKGKTGDRRGYSVFCDKHGFVYCKEVTGGRKRRGRRLGTHGKSETNKEQKEGRKAEIG